jgi:hypothetical protein
MCVRTSENRELPYYCTLNFNIVKMHPHTVSLIPELLEKILNFMNRDHNVTNACVCKQWSEIALDIIWREVKSLPRLLGLLRPYEKRDASFVRDLFSKSPPANMAGYRLCRSSTGSQTYGTGQDFKSMLIVCALYDTVRD